MCAFVEIYFFKIEPDPILRNKLNDNMKNSICYAFRLGNTMV